MQGLTWHQSFRPQLCNFTISSSAVTIKAGMQWREIYAEAGKRNQSIVGGATPTVGIGGYIAGGGHSPISAKYGMAADSVIEIRAVTAMGQIVVANECQHQDLFWALRGVSVALTVLVKR